MEFSGSAACNLSVILLIDFKSGCVESWDVCGLWSETTQTRVPALASPSWGSLDKLLNFLSPPSLCVGVDQSHLTELGRYE